MKLTVDEVIEHAKSLEGTVLYTLAKPPRPFTVEVKDGGLRFLPQFSTQPRAFRRSALEDGAGSRGAV